MEKTIPPGEVVLDVPLELRVIVPLKSVLGFSAKRVLVLLYP